MPSTSMLVSQSVANVLEPRTYLFGGSKGNMIFQSGSLEEL